MEELLLVRVPRASYGDMGRRFDDLFDDVERLTELEATSLDAILRPAGVRVVLDCAAGTGIQALGLAALGYEVVASDISPTMLRVLADKAAERHLSVPTRRQDFRRLTPWRGRRIGAVVCAGGSLTLVPTDGDVAKAIGSMVRLASRECGLVVVGHHNYLFEKGRRREFVLRRPFTSAASEIAFDVRQFDEDHALVIHTLLSYRRGRWQSRTSPKAHRYLSVSRLRELLLDAGCSDVRLLDLSATEEIEDGEWVLAVGTTSPG